MTRRDERDSDFEPLQLEAIDWVVRLTVGGATDADARDFTRWRDRSPDHADAFRRAEQFCDELRALPLSAAPASAPEETIIPFPRRNPAIGRRAFLGGGGALAASIIGGVLIARPPLGLWPSYAELMADHRTGAGERQAFSPVAGVQVELNSRSSLSVVDDKNGVKLIAGEIFVAVAPRQRPFEVQAMGGRASSNGGSFTVRADSAGLCVTCVSGTVASERVGSRTLVKAGEALTYGSEGQVRRAAVDPSDVLAWRRGLLIFHGTPLGEAVVEINRYFPGRLILTDASKGGQPVTGVFHINQIELAVVQIQQLLDVSATRLPGGVVLLG